MSPRPDLPPFVANPEIQQEYGALFRFYEPQLGAYQTTLIMSEREHKIFLDRNLDHFSPPDKLREAMKLAFPNFPVDQVFKTDSDLQVFTAGMVARRGSIFEANGTLQMAGGGAVSLQIGPPDAPLRIGLVSLPLRSPATLADFSPLLSAEGQNRTDNQRDVRMITAGHEFYHLIDFAARNAYHYSANRDARMPQMDQKDEVYADRGLIGDIPALVRAGIVSDARIALDLIAARQLETMQRFALSRVQSGPGQGAVIVLDEHAVGYSLTSRDSLEAQQQRVIQAGTEIRAVFRNSIDRAFE